MIKPMSMGMYDLIVSTKRKKVKIIFRQLVLRFPQRLDEL